MVVYRMALYHPKCVSALIVVSTPYSHPFSGAFVTLKEFAARYTNFAYQVYLDSPQSLEDWKTKDDFVKFFNGMLQEGDKMSIGFRRLASVPKEEAPVTSMISQEEVAYYAEQYVKDFKGPTNWYRTRQLNHEDEVRYLAGHNGVISIPTLFIATNKDVALPPRLSKDMEKFFPKFTRRSVDTGHWGLVEGKEEVNAMVGEFLMRLVFEKMKHRI